ncbi:MAG TPA: molybdopterin molybdotransferase MoeA, partial [Burkholderiales bacterium]|nr:molybdopterin molybdotransferase MoeA [Burkholderiales bacterium]
MNSVEKIVSCLDGYDPHALRVDKAREAIRSCLVPVSAVERVATRAALGRVLAADIVPAFDVPAHDNSAMDGYAVRAADLKPDAETALDEIGSALAGRPYAGTVGAGECVRVMTGAIMPQGADAVVVQEVVRIAGDAIIVPAGQKRGQNMRYAGEDLKAGVPVLRPGRSIGPADLGVIASLGLAEVSVRRRLRVAFFSTGDELASVGAPLAP